MRDSLGEVALTRLRDDILNMTLLPGESLSERRLSEQLNLSRTPVREALRTLEHEGLVHRSNRSFEVAPIDLVEINEAFDFRLVIERAAVQLAGARINEYAELPVGDRFPGWDASLNSLSAQLRQGEEFHVRLVSIGGNRFLVQSLQALMPRLIRARLLEAARPGGVEEAGEEHMAIWELIESGEINEAESLLTQHIERSRKRLTEALTALDVALRSHGVALKR